MPEIAGLVAPAIVMGVAGSAAMDAWSAVLRRRFGISTLDYRLLGRWIGHMPHSQFVHHRIASASPIPREGVIGWAAHYAIGIALAYLLVVLVGSAWLASPTPWPALVVGWATIVAPWFVMQPAMGVGVAATRSPNPTATRLRNLGTHTVYGLGVYMSAAVLALAALRS